MKKIYQFCETTKQLRFPTETLGNVNINRKEWRPGLPHPAGRQIRGNDGMGNSVIFNSTPDVFSGTPTNVIPEGCSRESCLCETPCKKRAAGFTLIELLVVVLIIGILSAVALPQYQTAVEKSRLATVMQNVRHGKELLELYYLANGEYPDDLSETGFQISGCSYVSKIQLMCKGSYYHYIDKNHLAAVLIPDTSAYEMKLTHTASSGEAIKCLAKKHAPAAQRACLSLGGEKISGPNSYGWVIYKL